MKREAGIGNVAISSLTVAGKTGCFQSAQQSLKEMYIERFQTVYPFSSPSTLDTDNIWIPLALKQSLNNWQVTEDHIELVKRAFKSAKILLIKGNPATGKTSLMRRLAYEWAKQEEKIWSNAKVGRLGKRKAGGKRKGRKKQGGGEMLPYDVVLYAEFCKVREKAFESIAELALFYLKYYLNDKEYENLENLINDEHFCKQHKILVLLDGYDESTLQSQCSQLTNCLFDGTIIKPLLFNVVMTTRKGPISMAECRCGRFASAEVAGFLTAEQKQKYITNHFASTESDNGEKIATVHDLLDKNISLNKFAQTPLFLTFICLVHEWIVDGTLVELYSKIIWWLIDRYQKDFPDCNVPDLFGFKSETDDNLKTIEDHFFQFPQLHYLSKMAFKKIGDYVFEEADCQQYNLEPILEQVGLLKRERKYDHASQFYFAHRTIQEFLAAFYCFCVNEQPVEWPSSDITSDIRCSTGHERFLFRIALSDKLPIIPERRQLYFENINKLVMELKFDAFNSSSGLNCNLFNWFISQCSNIKKIGLNHKKQMALPSGALLAFKDLRNLESLSLRKCNIEDFQIYLENCPSLQIFLFDKCEMKGSNVLHLANQRDMKTLQFQECRIVLDAWRSITDEITKVNIRKLLLSFKESLSQEFINQRKKCNKVEKIKVEVGKWGDWSIMPPKVAFNDLTRLHSLTFVRCNFVIDSQNFLENCVSFKKLRFRGCKIKCNDVLRLANLPGIKSLHFEDCEIDSNAQNSTVDEMTPVKKFSLFFDKSSNDKNQLQKWDNKERMEIQIVNFSDKNGLLQALFSCVDFTGLHSLMFVNCTFDTNSQIHFNNRPFLELLTFDKCEMKCGNIFHFANLPAINTIQLKNCNIDLNTFVSLADQVRKISVHHLKLYLANTFNQDYVNQLKTCDNVGKIEVRVDDSQEKRILSKALLSFDGLTNLYSLIFRKCTFESDSPIYPENCPSLKILLFDECEMRNKVFGSASVSPIDVLRFRSCRIDLNAWVSITDEISKIKIHQLKSSFANAINQEYLNQLKKCDNVKKMKIRIGIPYKESIVSSELFTSFNDLTTLHTLTFLGCSFETNFQIITKSCPSIKKLKFKYCHIENNIILGLKNVPALYTLQIQVCTIDLKVWKLITDEIKHISIIRLKLSYYSIQRKEAAEFFKHLEKCERIEILEILSAKYGSEELLTKYLSQLAKEMKGLELICFEDEMKGTEKRSKETIEKAGKERDPRFLVGGIENFSDD